MFTIVTSVTKSELYDWRLKHSLELEQADYKLILTNPKLPLSTSYNSIGNIDTNYVMFVHQDVIFLENEDFLSKAEKMCNILPKLGVAGIWGQRRDGKVIGGQVLSHERLGNYQHSDKVRIYDKKLIWEGKEYAVQFRFFVWGGGGDKDVVPFSLLKKRKFYEVRTLDDPVLIITKDLWNKMRFDETFKFHLIAEDYCISAHHYYKLKSYVLPLKTWRIHSPSVEIHKNDDYWKQSLERLGNKWRKKEPPIFTFLGRTK